VVLVYLFWSPERQRWGLTRKKVFALPIGCFLFALILYFRIFQYFLYYYYVPDELSLYSITHRYLLLNPNGRSNYLYGIDVKSWWEFLFWTPIRSIYFWISPVVFDWNSILDPIAVLADALPLAVLITAIVRKPKQAKNGKAFYAGVIVLLLYTLLYAWGVTNAGTAMRHRNMLLGVLIMTYGMRVTERTENGKSAQSMMEENKPEKSAEL